MRQRERNLLSTLRMNANADKATSNMRNDGILVND